MSVNIETPKYESFDKWKLKKYKEDKEYNEDKEDKEDLEAILARINAELALQYNKRLGFPFNLYFKEFHEALGNGEVVISIKKQESDTYLITGKRKNGTTESIEITSDVYNDLAKIIFLGIHRAEMIQSETGDRWYLNYGSLEEKNHALGVCKDRFSTSPLVEPDFSDGIHHSDNLYNRNLLQITDLGLLAKLQHYSKIKPKSLKPSESAMSPLMFSNAEQGRELRGQTFISAATAAAQADIDSLPQNVEPLAVIGRIPRPSATSEPINPVQHDSQENLRSAKNIVEEYKNTNKWYKIAHWNRKSQLKFLTEFEDHLKKMGNDKDKNKLRLGCYLTLIDQIDLELKSRLLKMKTKKNLGSELLELLTEEKDKLKKKLGIPAGNNAQEKEALDTFDVYFNSNKESSALQKTFRGRSYLKKLEKLVVNHQPGNQKRNKP